ncbi:hypothetical protein [Qipengyuania aquimaris]|uniref:hypothetical protein n=1 Tax=Qipengyuania aquimaris TaxID=255984 RepID=UPI001CD33B24|nr:hypothetical protein [Qipengyuania aquimaris]MCA0902519.1 hypothetical protein [Qipengyuania aquimaris]
MKPIYGQFAAACALTIGLAGCIPPSPEPTPAPSPAPVSTPSPTPTPTPVAQAPVTENWIDAPQTAGDWSYRKVGRGSVASFGPDLNEPLFALGCDPDQRQIEIIISPRPQGAQIENSEQRIVTIRTETADRTLTALPVFQGGGVRTQLQPRDPLLDAMALTRGRFAVETSNSPPLYLPAWSEVTRVIEDCR